jgi:hypothetical protein
MTFLSDVKCSEWCKNHGYRIHKYWGNGPKKDLINRRFARVEHPHPTDSGRKVCLAKSVFHTLGSGETLIWVANWEVWPSSGHLPLSLRFREALGEKRPLDEAPGHLAGAEEIDDGISVVIMALEFFWDCLVLHSSGENMFFASHDEYWWFGSKDKARVDGFEAAFGPEKDMGG